MIDQGETPARTGPTSSGMTVTVLASVGYIVVLAGKFGLDRLGLEYTFGVPERAFGALGLLTLVVIASSVRRQKTRRVPKQGVPSVGIFPLVAFVFLAYMLIGALWSPPGSDVQTKVIDLITLGMIAVAFWILGRWDRRKTIKTLAWCSFLAGIVYGVAGLTSIGTTVGTSRVSAFEGGPNVFARITALGFIALLWLVSTRSLPRAALVVGPVLLAATLASGSRGGMLGGLAGTAILVPSLIRMSRATRFSGALLMVGAGMAVQSRFGDYLEAVINGRIIELTFRQRYSSGREELLQIAWEMFQERPVFGYGLGSFASFAGGNFTYPHNLFLQVLAESGVVGMVLLGLLVLVSVRAAMLRRSHADSAFAAAGCTLVLVASMFSGDYYDSRAYWVLALLLALPCGSGQETAVCGVSETAQRFDNSRSKKSRLYAVEGGTRVCRVVDVVRPLARA